MAAAKKKSRRKIELGTYDKLKMRKLVFTGLGAAIGALLGQAYAENPAAFEKAFSSLSSHTRINGMSIEEVVAQMQAESFASAAAASSKTKKSKDKPS